MIRLTRHYGPTVLGMVVLLAGWSLVALFGGTAHHVVPQPFAVAATVLADGFYADNLVTTGWEALRGFLIGNLLALVLAALCLLAPRTRPTVTRVAAASYCAPAVAIGPILAVLLDPDRAKVIISALSVLFTTLLGAVLGLSGATTSALELVHVSGGSRLFGLLAVRARAAVPALVAALALSAPAALLGAIVGEYLGGDRGLGVAMVQAQQALQVPRTWGIAVVTAGVAGLACAAVTLAGRRLRFVAVTSEAGGARWLGDPVAQPAWVRVGRASLRVVVAVLGTVLLWWGGVRLLGLDPYLTKTPGQVLGYLGAGPDAAGHRAVVGRALLTTLRNAGGGYLAGTVLAVLLAGLMLSSPFAEAMFLPIALALRSVPLVAMTPLAALVFGRGAAGVIALATTITVVPTLVNLLAALRETPKPALELVRAYSMGRLRALGTVRLRYALPALAMSARMAIPGALLGATLAEYLVTGSGLGGLIAVSASNSDLMTLWVAVVVVTAVSVVLFSLLSRLETAAARQIGH